ncbi:MAG TPA: hypothetical protein PLQ12_07175 [Candidatus Defluviicoccus seviourii]|nr:hypothetical protein [Candidatus Defluviicoccus seviourii]
MKVLLFARIENLSPESCHTAGRPRCLVIRCDSDIAPEVLQGLLVDALRKEYERWRLCGWAPPSPATWGRWWDRFKRAWLSSDEIEVGDDSKRGYKAHQRRAF